LEDTKVVIQLLPLPNAEEETGTSQEPQASKETDKRKRSRSPKEGLEEMRGSG
jgi:hypothetical protein